MTNGIKVSYPLSQDPSRTFQVFSLEINNDRECSDSQESNPGQDGF